MLAALAVIILLRDNYNMNNPLLSVVIPIYKAERYLRRCLESVLSQSYTNIEVFCVDDGSPDHSAEILEEYAARDKRLKIIHQSNQGQSAARMAGLRNCSGEWVAMVDSDDYLEPDIYRKAVAAIGDDIDVVWFNARVVGEGRSVKGMTDYLRVKKTGKQPVTPRLVCTNSAVLWNKLWRRDIIVQNGISMPEKHIHEDDVFYFNFMSLARNVNFLRDIGYNYVIHQGSLSDSYELDSVEGLIAYSHTWDYILKFHSDHHLLESRAETISEKLGFYLRQSSNRKRLEERNCARMAFLALLDKYCLSEYPAYERLLSVYRQNVDCMSGENLKLQIYFTEKKLRLAKIQYKLSFGKKRHFKKLEYWGLCYSLQRLRDCLGKC